MSKRMDLSLSNRCVARLLLGEEVYEVVSRRAYKFKVGYSYELYGIPDTYVKVLSSELMCCSDIPSSIMEDIASSGCYEEYIDGRCGQGTWALNYGVCLLRLVVSDEPNIKARQKDNFIRKVWIKDVQDEGMFISRKCVYDVGSVVACSEPYCVLVEKYGDAYRDMLCKAFGVRKEYLCRIAGWTNRSHTKGCYLPQRVRIVYSKVCNAKEISEREWFLLGVSNSYEERMRVIGCDYMYYDCNVRLYKYELVTNNAFEKEVGDGKVV